MARLARSPRSTDVAPDAEAAACGQSCNPSPRAGPHSGWITLIISALDMTSICTAETSCTANIAGPLAYYDRASYELAVQLRSGSMWTPDCFKGATICCNGADMRSPDRLRRTCPECSLLLLTNVALTVTCSQARLRRLGRGIPATEDCAQLPAHADMLRARTITVGSCGSLYGPFDAGQQCAASRG